ncbi:hypothetical protein [Aromatoleum tolulyticum]|nr:hypothetical protein [Aromatoleum tolulyticum]
MTRAFRRFIARLGIAALLFMQLAVAAYACPGVADSSRSPMVMDSAVETMPTGDCAMLDQSAPTLCDQHCQQDGQAAGHASPPMFAADLPLLVVLPVVQACPPPVAFDVSREFLTHATAPPPAIGFGAFRS